MWVFKYFEKDCVVSVETFSTSYKFANSLISTLAIILQAHSIFSVTLPYNFDVYILPLKKKDKERKSTENHSYK